MWLKGLQRPISMGYDWKVEYPTANKQNHRVKIKILFCSLLLTQDKEPEWRVKLSLLWLRLIFNALLPSIGLASTDSLLATHMWDGWPMLPCQQFCGQRTWLSVLMQHTALFGDHTYHFALQKLSANIAKWISQSRSVQHEEILDDHQQGCWIWPCITQLQGMGFTFANGTPEILQCFSDSKTLTNIMELGGQSG